MGRVSQKCTWSEDELDGRGSGGVGRGTGIIKRGWGWGGQDTYNRGGSSVRDRSLGSGIIPTPRQYSLFPVFDCKVGFLGVWWL